MKYLIMLTDIEGEWDKLSKSKQDAVMNQHMATQKELKAKDKYRSCGRLPSKGAKTVRLRPDGSRVVTDGPGMIMDGPHAATKEVMGGYYIIESDSMEEAMQWAAKIPMAYCSMEVRELWED